MKVCVMSSYSTSCHISMVTSALRAQAGGSCEPRSLRLQRAMIMPLHSSLEHTVRPPSQKKGGGRGEEEKDVNDRGNSISKTR